MLTSGTSWRGLPTPSAASTRTTSTWCTATRRCPAARMRRRAGATPSCCDGAARCSASSRPLLPALPPPQSQLQLLRRRLLMPPRVEQQLRLRPTRTGAGTRSRRCATSWAQARALPRCGRCWREPTATCSARSRPTSRPLRRLWRLLRLPPLRRRARRLEGHGAGRRSARRRGDSGPCWPCSRRRGEPLAGRQVCSRSVAAGPGLGLRQ